MIYRVNTALATNADPVYRTVERIMVRIPKNILILHAALQALVMANGAVVTDDDGVASFNTSRYQHCIMSILS